MPTVVLPSPSSPPSPSLSPRTPVVASWRDLVWPREHGSWSLALEPLALGLIAAPSAAGAALALAAMAAFLARRPLRLALAERSPERRAKARAWLGALAAVAAGWFAGAILLGGSAWLGWLLPVVVAGAAFLFFDLRAAGRAELAEIAGATTFALLPAAIATLGGWPAASACALALVMVGRAVPAVAGVRAYLRAMKTGQRRALPALALAGGAALVGLFLAGQGLVPATAAAWLGLMGLRSVLLLAWPRPTLKAKGLGMIEAGLGLVFVITVGIAAHK